VTGSDSVDGAGDVADAVAATVVSVAGDGVGGIEGAVNGAGSVVGIAIAVEVDVGGHANAVIAETWGGVDTEVGTAG